MPTVPETPRFDVLVLGSFVADVSFRVPRLPAWGETLLGSSFTLGPGGKGSNQAIAAARAGARVQMVTRLGADEFGEIARKLWAESGVDASLVQIADVPTGSAAILIDEVRGENGIIIVPGACFTLNLEHVNSVASAIEGAGVLLTQLELPLPTVERGLRIAHEAGVATILNPAPAPDTALPSGLLQTVEYLIPNESEAARLTGLPVTTSQEAEAAARALQGRGARYVIVTLGERGSVVCPPGESATFISTRRAGEVLETTGAGDAFCGAFAAKIAEGADVLAAASFASAGGGISVTRAGAAASMPTRSEIEGLLAAERASAKPGC